MDKMNNMGYSKHRFWADALKKITGEYCVMISLISCLSLGVDVKAGQQPLWVHLIDRLANSI